MADKRPPMPFKEIADAALNSIAILVPDWLPGSKTKSGEYSVRNPTRSDSHAGSFSVRMSGTKSGSWADFATGDAGSDLISLYAYIHYLDQYEAAIEVADEIGFSIPEACRPVTDTPRPKKPPVVDHTQVKPKKVAEVVWVPFYPDPMPADMKPVPVAHSVRGKPDMQWAYRDAAGVVIGYVYLFRTSTGGKEIAPLVYCKNTKTGAHDWRFMQWTAPKRPMYGLDRLAERPDAYVVLVEGEKCADALNPLISGVAVSWPGGSQAIKKVDFSPLLNRKVFAWPDCDAQREALTSEEKKAGIDPESKPIKAEPAQPGSRAMLEIREQLIKTNPLADFRFIAIPAPGDKISGWDCADAIAEGMNAAALTQFISNTRTYESLIGASVYDDMPAENAKTKKNAKPATAQDVQIGENEPSADDKKKNWESYLLSRKGDLVSCLANVVDILENDKRWHGVIAYDEFSQRVVKLKPPPYWNGNGAAGEWDSVDDANTAMWITKLYRFAPSASLISEAVEAMSHTNIINPPRDWLESLVWDGNKRLKTWMTDFLGVEQSQYTELISYWYLMGIVKRVYEPGAKFDYCLVLEGDQGLKKSSLFAALGGDWYGDTDLDLNNKDSMSAIRGKMVYELSELGALAKSEATKQKSFLARQIDEFRAAYGKREIRAKRTVVFGGTTNEWEWNKDATGGRRWWPVKVTQEVDTEGVLAARDQLFAEAVALVKAGKRYWPTQEEQKKLFDPVQLASTKQESFVDLLEDHLNLYTGNEFTLAWCAQEWLKLGPKDLSRDVETRIGSALRQLGCTRIEKRRSTVSRYWYVLPAKSDKTQQDRKEYDDDIPF
jgi:putative DNA primase/helicase